MIDKWENYKKHKKTRCLETIIRYNKLIPIRVGNLMYVDDIVIITDNNKTQKLVNKWVKEIEKMMIER